jgi:hypothetical protein
MAVLEYVFEATKFVSGKALGPSSRPCNNNSSNDNNINNNNKIATPCVPRIQAAHRQHTCANQHM